MKFSLVSGDAAKLKCDLLILPVFDTDLSGGKVVSKAFTSTDRALKGLLLRTAVEEEFAGKADQSLIFHTHDKVASHRVMLAGLGSRQKFDVETLRLACGKAAKAALKLGAVSVALALPEVRETVACARASVEGLLLGGYRFDRYKSKERDGQKKEPAAIALLLPAGVGKSKELEHALWLGSEVAHATNWARDLVNEPANRLTPSSLAEIARQVGKADGLQVEVLGKERIEKLSMGMFLGVAQGSEEPPALIHVRWTPPGKAAHKPALAFVGKAITFDSGGLSLKPTDGMMDMKGDMAGAAAVLGAMRVVARLKPPFPVHALMGACENMPSGKAYKIGDVLKSRAGKTVEITNTDAEGRLVLGDMLTYAAELKPAAIVDLATLTGACVVALGNHIAGAFGNEDAVVWEVLEAARAAGEEMWRLPMLELQKDTLKSEVADLKNTGERWGGAINAALFLREFVGETPWVHLDIAGPSMSSKERGYFGKGATGIGVRTLVEMVRSRAKA
jgi:leucyl aminopeptidase